MVGLRHVSLLHDTQKQTLPQETYSLLGGGSGGSEYWTLLSCIVWREIFIVACASSGGCRGSRHALLPVSVQRFLGYQGVSV